MNNEHCLINWKTSRLEVLAKIIIDSFQLRSVDLAAVLTMAECMLEAQEAGDIRYDSCQDMLLTPGDGRFEWLE